jgi:hypothetical protein
VLRHGVTDAVPDGQTKNFALRLPTDQLLVFSPTFFNGGHGAPPLSSRTTTKIPNPAHFLTRNNHGL